MTADVIGSARYSYMLDKWQGQPNYVEVWVEKDALLILSDRLADHLTHLIFHVGVTHHSQKCGVQHNGLFDRVTGKTVSSFI